MMSQNFMTQLPIDWYFNEKIFQLEKSLLFDNGSGYVGHQIMVPNAGNYHSLEWFDNHSKLLVNAGNDDFYLMSNVCRHRQAIMLKGDGKFDKNKNNEALVCPIHRWTYNGLNGDLVAAPHFPQNPCLNLNKSKLQNWNGLLFNAKKDIATDLQNLKPEYAKHFNFDDFKLDRTELHHCNYSWKTFIEIYLEDYHVAPFHPGLGNFVTCDDLTWQFEENYSIQRVGIQSLLNPGSKIYEKWHKVVREYYQDKNNGDEPPNGAVWMTYYPNLMLEWYPHVLVISFVVPIDLKTCMNVVEFYYPKDIVDFDREFIEAEQAAYMETAIEDDEIGERMDFGRWALYQQGQNEVGPYQSPMEDGMEHFHKYYRRNLETEIKKII